MQIEFVSDGEGKIVGKDNPLPTGNAAVGAVADSRVSDPDAASASLAALMRGVLYALQHLSLATGDIEIGAMEMKDGATDNRAKVGNADQPVASTDYGLVTRVVGLLATLGEVQASPTANTLLARLKAITDVMPAALGQGTMAQSARVVLASDHSVISVSGDGDVIAVTPTVDNNVAYAAGDLLFDLTTITNAVRAIGEVAYIKSLTVIDKDAQGIAMDVYVGNANTSLGTVNSAPNISDANVAANSIQRLCQIGSGDYSTLSGTKIATRDDISLEIKAAGGSRALYIAAVTQGAPTQTTGGLVLLVGLAWK